MTGTSESSIERLEEQLEGAEQTLATLRPLDGQQVERLAERMDRLASQLLAVSEPAAMEGMHQRLGTEPLSSEEFSGLAEEMSSPDGEG